jgi:hypothetical protein
MSGFNISRFSTNINQRGTLQNNKFLVQITVPSIRNLTSYNLGSVLEFRASSIKMPGIDFNIIQTYRYGIGPLQKTPTNVQFKDIGISFIEDKQNSIWKFFSTWMDQIFKFQPGTQGRPSVGMTYLAAYKDYYISPTMKILIFDNEGNTVNTINLTQAFPISLNDIDLSWSEQSELMKINVGFTFTEWYFDARPLNGVVTSTVSATVATTGVTPAPAPAAPAAPMTALGSGPVVGLEMGSVNPPNQ